MSLHAILGKLFNVLYFHLQKSKVKIIDYKKIPNGKVINRHGVAGAVLQSPLLLILINIDSVTLFLQSFKTSLDPNRKSQGAEILRECSPHVTYQVSGVTCQVSHVTCLE